MPKQLHRSLQRHHSACDALVTTTMLCAAHLRRVLQRCGVRAVLGECSPGVRALTIVRGNGQSAFAGAFFLISRYSYTKPRHNTLPV